jgi:transposase
MTFTNAQFDAIEPYLPIQRGNVAIDNRRFLEALFLVLKTGMQWRELDEQRFGKWNSIYRRANRWAKQGVLRDVFVQLQKQGIITVGILSLDSTSIKVHQDATGASKKTDHSPSAGVEEATRQKFIWSPQMLVRL